MAGFTQTPPYNVSTMRNQYYVAKGQNPFYHVQIKCANLGVEIVADMPEQTSSAVAGDYEAALAGVGSMPDVIAAGAQTNTVLQGLTRQIWRNSSPIEIPITILFDAESDALVDVYRPMRILEALALPTSGDPMGVTSAMNNYTGIGSSYINALGSASNVLVSPASGGNVISLTIGNMVNLPEVVLVSVNNTFDSRLSSTGYPISGQCEAVFRTIKAYTRAEWMQITNIQGAF